MSQPELKAFLRAVDSLRDHALFSFMYLYGLRVGEVVLHLREDVDFERGRILIRRCKGGVWAERPLFQSAARLLREQINRERAFNPDSPLFRGREGGLKKRQIQSLFSRYLGRAHLSRHYTCHSLRHSIATHLLDAGMSLEFVQDHLAHQSIRSTSTYARITDRHRAAVYEQLEGSPWIVRPELIAPPEERKP